jgi:hypothetical protein
VNNVNNKSGKQNAQRNMSATSRKHWETMSLGIEAAAGLTINGAALIRWGRAILHTPVSVHVPRLSDTSAVDSVPMSL